VLFRPVDVVDGAALNRWQCQWLCLSLCPEYTVATDDGHPSSPLRADSLVVTLARQIPVLSLQTVVRAAVRLLETAALYTPVVPLSSVAASSSAVLSSTSSTSTSSQRCALFGPILDLVRWRFSHYNPRRL
jgi:hypothetical protein